MVSRAPQTSKPPTYRLPSLRYWQWRRNQDGYQPITNLIYNLSKWRSQQAWFYRRVQPFFQRDLMRVHTLLDNQNHPPPIAISYGDRALTLVPGIAYMIGGYLLLNAVEPLLVALFGMAMLLVAEASVLNQSVMIATYSVSEEIDANRFDLLAVTPQGPVGVIGAISGVAFRQRRNYEGTQLTWLGRSMYLLGMWLPIGGLMIYLGLQTPAEVFLMGGYYGLMNVPTVIMFFMAIAICQVQMMVIAHLAAIGAWTYTRDTLLIRVGVNISVFTVLMLIFAACVWLALTAAALLGYPVLRLLFNSDSSFVPVWVQSVVAALLTITNTAAIEVLVWGLLRWYARLDA